MGNSSSANDPGVCRSCGVSLPEVVARSSMQVIRSIGSLRGVEKPPEWANERGPLCADCLQRLRDKP